MTMVTCPACSTVFRVSPEQLAARAGLVRCGRCLTVFNARDRTVQEPAPMQKRMPAESAVASDPPSSPIADPVPPASTGGIAAALQEGPELALGLDTASTAPGSEADRRPQSEQQVAIPLPGVLLAKESVDSPSPAEDQARPEPISFDVPGGEESPPASLRRYAWVALAAAGAVLAVLQTIYLFRNEMALASPAMQPALVRFCAGLGCQIELPRQADQIHIDTSDLQPDADRKDLLVLTALVKNRASFVQAFPHLELALTNGRNQALARRVIGPELYLPAQFDPQEGFPPHGEISLRLVIDATRVGAVGYQLYMFYP